MSGIDGAYRESLLKIIRAYVRSIKIGNPNVSRMEPQEPLSDKKEALMRMEELRAEVYFSCGF